jgi:DNA-binding LytR/AlgR family response regulator
VEAYEDYSYVNTAAQKYLTSYRLKYLEERLAPHRFFRVHRKYLVNLDMVTEIASLPGSNFMLRTAGRTRIELPISRRRLASLKQVLGF